MHTDKLLEARQKIEHLIKPTITHVGKIDDKKWPHFLWSILINNEHFSYKCGLAHVEEKAKRHGIEKARAPKIEDVLHCLFLDSDCGDRSFYDFCGEFGYDRDSLSAFNTYNDCQKNGEKLRKALGKQYKEIKELIEGLEL